MTEVIEFPVIAGELSAQDVERADPGFFHRLHRRLHSRIARVFRHNGDVSAHEIEDLTQVGMLRVVDRISRFRGGRFAAWAMTVAIRAARTALRRRRATTATAAFEERMLADATDTCPVLAAERSELFRIMDAAIRKSLTARQRKAILGILTGRSAADVARELDSSPNAVHKLCHDARVRLRGELEARGVSWADVASVTSGETA